MSIRPIREDPAAREIAELISDFDRPSFGTLREMNKRMRSMPQMMCGGMMRMMMQ